MRITAFVITILFLANVSTFGQDTLWVEHQNKEKFLRYTVKDKEDLFTLSKRFKVPPARLADYNQTNFKNGISAGLQIKIPIEGYNYYRINSVVRSKPIYHRTTPGESLRSLSRLYNIPQSVILEWNRLRESELRAGQVIQVGWMAFNDNVQVAGPKQEVRFPTADTKETDLSEIPKGKTEQPLSKAEPISEEVDEEPETVLSMEEEFIQQTKGFALNSESGAVVFYPFNVSSEEGHYFAFHNFLPRGSIVKVENPANGRVIYAKVIGEIPNINKYHRAILGLSDNAVAALLAKDKRMFAKIYYR